MQRLYSLPGLLFELIYVAKDDGVGGTGLCAGWLYPYLLPVVAEGAFRCGTSLLTAADDAEGARGDAVATSVADVGLHIDISKFVANDGTGWTGFHAARVCAVFAYVAHHEPVDRFASAVGGSLALHKGDMPPGCGGEGDGIVVTMPTEFVSVGRQLIPLFARDLAGFAADAERGVGEKSVMSHLFSLSPLFLLRHLTRYDTAVLPLM